MKKSNSVFDFLVLAIFLLAVVPLVWFILDVNNIPSKIGVPMDAIPGQWSTILIGYFASVLGAITGFIATAYSVKKSIDNQKKSREEDNAIAALPLLQINNTKILSEKCDAIFSCKFDSLGDVDDKTYTTGALLIEPNAKITIKNVGQREMYALRAKCMRNGYFLESDEPTNLFPIIYKEEEKTLGIDILTAVMNNYYKSPMNLLSSEPKYSTEKITIAFIFSDCYGNDYEQLAQIDMTYALREAKRKTYQIFENSVVKECKIVSAPKKIGR